jgi:diaminopimelate decarboxylase
LIGEAGVYLTRVIRKKRSRGTEICTCDGGMNHHLAAAGHLGAVLPRNYRMFKVGGGSDTEADQRYTLVGPLCTSIDTLGRNVRFRGLEAGDLIGIECSGAYGLTASPIHFISHVPPKEIVVEGPGNGVAINDATQFSAHSWEDGAKREWS